MHSLGLLFSFLVGNFIHEGNLAPLFVLIGNLIIIESIMNIFNYKPKQPYIITGHGNALNEFCNKATFTDVSHSINVSCNCLQTLSLSLYTVRLELRLIIPLMY